MQTVEKDTESALGVGDGGERWRMDFWREKVKNNSQQSQKVKQIMLP
jgi:hypothetical protein